MSAVNALAITLLESAPSPRAWGCGFTPSLPVCSETCVLGWLPLKALKKFGSH